MPEAELFSAQWWTQGRGSWMAWTWATAAFFIFIAAAIACMGLLEWRKPGGAPRDGILALSTTRGDRLFITLLGSAYIFMAWIFFAGASSLLPPLGICVLFALIVFRFV